MFALILVYDGQVVHGKRIVGIFPERKLVCVDGFRVFSLIIKLHSPVVVAFRGSGIIDASCPRQANQ